MNIKLSDFDYHLPKELIAQQPVRPRDSSRLMVVHKGSVYSDGGRAGDNASMPLINIEHRRFRNIIDYFQEGDMLVLNDTKVLANKLCGKKPTGAPASIIIEAKEKGEKGVYKCRVQTNKPKIGGRLEFDGLVAEIIRRKDDLFWLKFSKDNIEDYLAKHGTLPTPAYVRQQLKRADHYQTSYAKNAGSLAAPTSGLHFTTRLLEKLKKKGVRIVFVTLHISFGTFTPIDENKPLSEHRMDPEYFEITKAAAKAINNRKGRLVVCGTTSFKALESSADKDGRIMPTKAWSDLFISPGYRFRVRPDMMITNFHLPRSTLLLLVSAYFGREIMLKSYEEAVKNKYRFFSLGDAMVLIEEKR